MKYLIAIFTLTLLSSSVFGACIDEGLFTMSDGSCSECPEGFYKPEGYGQCLPKDQYGSQVQCPEGNYAIVDGECVNMDDPDPVEDESCDDGILNQDEEDVDCGGICGPCERKLLLDQEKYLVNFDGKMQIKIEGKAINGKKPLPNIEIKPRLSYGANRMSEDIGKMVPGTATTDSNGRFSFTYTLPEIKDRAKFGGDYISIQLVSGFHNPEIYLYQSSTPPVVKKISRRSDRQVGVETWTTLDFEVLDLEDDIERIEIMSTAGMIKIKNKENIIQKGTNDMKGDKAYVIEIDYYEDMPTEFGFFVPKIGLEFDTTYLGKIKEAFFGTKPEENWMPYDMAKGFGPDMITGKMGEELINKVEFFSQLELAAGEKGFDFDPELVSFIKGDDNLGGVNRALKLSKKTYGSKELNFRLPRAVGTFMSAYKLGSTAQSTYNNAMKQVDKMLTEDMGFFERMYRSMNVALDAYSFVEGGCGLAGPYSDNPKLDFYKFEGSNVVKNLKSMGKDAALTLIKGSLSYLADTYEEARAEPYVKNIPVVIQAYDSQGHKSLRAVTYIEVNYYSSNGEQ